jgi:hypothetical protein
MSSEIHHFLIGQTARLSLRRLRFVLPGRPS